MSNSAGLVLTRIRGDAAAGALVDNARAAMSGGGVSTGPHGPRIAAAAYQRPAPERYSRPAAGSRTINAGVLSTRSRVVPGTARNTGSPSMTMSTERFV